MKVTKLPPGPQSTSFQEFQFDENLGEKPLLQRAASVQHDVETSKGWKPFLTFLGKAKDALKDSNT